MPLSKYLPFIAWLFSLPLGVGADAGDVNFQLRTNPAAAMVRPFSDVVKLSLAVSDSSGKPIDRGEATVILEAPPPGAFLSTDFPFVEGTRLLETRLPIRQGLIEWQQLLPIRGVYRLSVGVGSADSGSGRQTFEIAVPENREKKLWLGLFCTMLLLVGFVAGRVFTRDEAISGLALIFFASGFALAHQAAQTMPVKKESGAVEVEPPVVGKPAAIRWRNGSAAAEPGLLSISITHLEKNKTVLVFEKLAVGEDFSFSFHFPDGAQYLIKTAVELPGQPVQRTEQNIAVTGVEPSLRMQLPSLAFFLTIIAFGLGAGRWSKRG